MAAAQDLALPALPLLVQAHLFNDLLLGRTDFVERAMATLQAYVKWGGALKFIPAEAGKTEPAHPQQVAVVMPQQPAFGTLHVERAGGSATSPAAAAALHQAAHWLASLLSIARRYEQLRALAITDELSGAYNRRYFTKFMSGLLDRAKEKRFRITLLLFDIDDFKKYNDTFGHASGDAIIRELIKLLRACTRPHDLVARIGGDEFAVVYWDNEAPRHPNSEHPRDAVTATERFRKAVKMHQWSAACNIKGEVSISGGLATFPWDADSLETLMTRADEALLRAKAGGKNVFLLHGQSVPAEQKSKCRRNRIGCRHLIEATSQNSRITYGPMQSLVASRSFFYLNPPPSFSAQKPKDANPYMCRALPWHPSLFTSKTPLPPFHSSLAYRHSLKTLIFSPIIQRLPTPRTTHQSPWQPLVFTLENVVFRLSEF